MEEETIDESSGLLSGDQPANNDVTVKIKLFDWRLYNVVIVGVAFMFLFTAFQTGSMVETLVLDGARKESGGNFTGSGYTSLAIIYAVMGVSNWIAPSVVAVLTAKWSMLAGAITYCLFIASFLKPMAVLLYGSSALVGIGAAVLWTAQGKCLTLNSDQTTLSRNIGIFFALFQSSILIGNIYVFFKFVGVTDIESDTRQPMFIVLTILGVVGTLMFIVIRQLSPTQTGSEENTKASQGPWQAVKTSIKLIITKEMLLLAFTFAYTGFEQSFWTAVYGTSVGHTKYFGDFAKQLTGLCGIFIGIGEILGTRKMTIKRVFVVAVTAGALTLSFLSTRLKSLGKDLIILLGLVIHVVAFYLVFLSLPAESPLRSTDALSYITPNKYLAVVCAFLLGLGDSFFNTQVYGIIGALYPDDSAPAFALFVFIQSLAYALAFVYSQALTLEWQLLLLVLCGCVGSLCFFKVDYWAREKNNNGNLIVNDESHN